MLNEIGLIEPLAALLQGHRFTPDVTRILRNMKAARQEEAVELRVASNTITVTEPQNRNHGATRHAREGNELETLSITPHEMC